MILLIYKWTEFKHLEDNYKQKKIPPKDVLSFLKSHLLTVINVINVFLNYLLLSKPRGPQIAHFDACVHLKTDFGLQAIF